jgi:tRNA(Ile)-lysidine synthase
MVDRFREFIEQKGLCRETDRILIAVSGGVDSVVMLDLFLKNGFKTGLAHCNFGLRADESDGDEEFVRRLAGVRGVTCYVEHFETEKIASEKQISTQMAARKLRYDWFEEIRSGEGFNYIATGHNFNDSVETMVFNLIKGTGLRGLTGISAKTGNVIRPLLFARREEIEAYASENNLAFRSDSSNTSVKYHRNYLRHEIIPEFRNINPGFEVTIRNTLERLGGIQRFVNYLLETEKKSYMSLDGKDIYLKNDFFSRINEPAILYEVISKYGFNYDQCESITAGLGSEAGKVFYSEEFILNIDRDHLIISPKQQTEARFEISKKDKLLVTDRFNLTFEILETTPVLSPDRHIAYLDLEKLHYPLVLRSWKKGDWFMPLGMKGKKKLSDFMIDKKIPLNLKKRIMVLLSKDSIAWVVGHRIDDRFKIDSKTRKILKIIYQELDDKSL